MQILSFRKANQWTGTVLEVTVSQGHSLSIIRVFFLFNSSLKTSFFYIQRQTVDKQLERPFPLFGQPNFKLFKIKSNNYFPNKKVWGTNYDGNPLTE